MTQADFTERRCNVQSDTVSNDYLAVGTVAWAEHIEIVALYNKPTFKASPEHVAETGGLSLSLIVSLLGRLPSTYRAL